MTQPDPMVPAEVVARSDAAARRAVRYFDGRPCVLGHVSERYTRNATCCACQRGFVRANKARIRALLNGDTL